MRDLVKRLLENDLLEVGRKAIEDCLIELRDSGISQLRGNGLVIREANGARSSTIRMGPEDALRIGIRAMGAAIEKEATHENA